MGTSSRITREICSIGRFTNLTLFLNGTTINEFKLTPTNKFDQKMAYPPREEQSNFFKCGGKDETFTF
jgi:hypothetical protein